MKFAIDTYCDCTGQEIPKTAADYCRVIFRSLALRYRQVVDILRGFAPFEIKRLHVIGGGSQNSYLMQYTADALDMPVICGPVEGTALGNVLVQLKAAGMVETLPQMRAISAASVELKEYMPQNPSEWNAVYDLFLEIQTRYEH